MANLLDAWYPYINPLPSPSFTRRAGRCQLLLHNIEQANMVRPLRGIYFKGSKQIQRRFHLQKAYKRVLKNELDEECTKNRQLKGLQCWYSKEKSTERLFISKRILY